MVLLPAPDGAEKMITLLFIYLTIIIKFINTVKLAMSALVKALPLRKRQRLFRAVLLRLFERNMILVSY